MALLSTLNYGGSNESVEAGYAKINAAINTVNYLGGGTTGQYLVKDSGNDFDFSWVTTDFATESYADTVASTEADAAEAAANTYTNGRTGVVSQGTTVVNSGDISKSSAAGTYSYGYADYCFFKFGRFCSLSFRFSADLSNAWLAGDYLLVDLSSTPMVLALNDAFGVCTIDTPSDLSHSNPLVAEVNTSDKKLKLRFQKDCNDPTGINGRIVATVNYISAS
jgi:hypothetical protein